MKERRNIEVSPTLATNIMLARNDSEFVNIEKAEIADAIYGIMSVKEDTDNRTKERLDSAMNVITSYLFILDLFKE